MCGFLGHNASLGSSKCFEVFSGRPGSMDYSGFNRSSWTLRTDSKHRQDISVVQKCTSKTERAKTESELGCRYSVLLELPSFDAPRLHIIDPMHNLFQGTGKHMIAVWIKGGHLCTSHLEKIQAFVDKLILPSDIGRIPYKIASGFSAFKADQFTLWITVYSIPALYGILPSDQLKCWRHYVLACRILCKHSLTKEEVAKADALLMHLN